MDLYSLFDELDIKYDEVSHKAVYTVDEAINEKISDLIDGVECKNLFVKSRTNYYLILIDSNKRANLKEIQVLLNESKLSFANEEELKEILGVGLGSVTPMGIINDTLLKVILLIDKDLIGRKILVHPNVNFKTISIEYNDLIKFIEYLRHKYLTF